MRLEGPLILGGGPAGAAAAIVLARGGLRPVVLERHVTSHDALCGGFLSWSTAWRLRALGVDPASLGAHPIETMRLFSGLRGTEARLPQPSSSLSRRVLDAALLACAEAEGAQVRRGVKVASLAGDGWVELAGGGQIHAPFTVLATGKHDLRGAGRPAVSADPALGLRWRLTGSPRLRGLVGHVVELHLFAGGYAGLALQEDGSANLCMVVRRRVLAAAGGDPQVLLEQLAAAHPALAARIVAAGGEPGAAQAIANVPYGWITTEPAGDVFRIGDQAAVIPSLAGEGMAIALASGIAAGEAIAQGLDAARFQRRLARRAWLPVRVAGAIARAGTGGAGGGLVVGTAALLPGLPALAARLSRMGEGQLYTKARRC